MHLKCKKYRHRFLRIDRVCAADQYTIYPWLHSSCNHLTDAHMLRPVTIPDVPPPVMVPGPGLLSMCAGDFAVSGWLRR